MIDLSGYKLTFDDEFSTQSYSRSGMGTNWGTVRTAMGPNTSVDHYFGDAAFVDAASGIDPFSVVDGALMIRAMPTPSIGGGDSWASGLLQSANSFSQQYGYFEIRAELPIEAGAWPAFWLLPSSGKWPPEIDVVETYGNAKVYQTVHSAHTGRHLFEETVTTDPDIRSGYHTYGVLWEPDTITFTVDGNIVGEQSTPADLHERMYMLLDLAITNGPGVEQSAKEMSVDYVRAFSKDPGAVPVALQTISSPDGVDTFNLHGAGATNVEPSVRPAENSLVVRVSGDAWRGYAQFVVEVDGREVGGVQTATASHASGQWQDVTVSGDFGSQPSKVAVRFVNDAWGGSTEADRNLYVESLSLNGVTLRAEAVTHSDGFVTKGAVMLYNNGKLAFDWPEVARPADPALAPAPVPHPPVPDPASSVSELTVRVSGDAWNGDAQFVVVVDGRQVGGVQTASASYAAAQWQDVTLTGDFGVDASKIAVRFVNDAWGGSDTADRNLYVESVSLEGTTIRAEAASHSDGFVKNGAVMLYNNGEIAFDWDMLSVPAAPVAPRVDTLAIRVSGDAWNGNAEFVVEVGGRQIGGTHGVWASHSAGQWQDVKLTGDFGSDPSKVEVRFVNDAWGGSTSADRNLYLKSVSLNGETVGAEAASHSDGFVTDGAVMLYNNGVVTFSDWLCV